MPKKYRKGDPMPLGVQVVLDLGYRKGTKVMAFVAAWAVARDALGELDDIETYGKWWRQSPATSYREQAAFREAFPQYRTPSELLDVLVKVQPAVSQWSKKANPGVLASQLWGVVLP